MIMKEKRSFQHFKRMMNKAKNILNSEKKTKTFNYLKYKRKTQNTSKINDSPNQTETPASEHQKSLYSSVLKKAT